MGAPRSDPEPSRVHDMLRRFGLDVVDVRPAGVSARSSHPFRAVTGDGRRLFVKVLDPDPRDTDWLFRLARVFALREVRDEDAMVSLPAEAEHEAAVTMAARAAWCPGS